MPPNRSSAEFAYFLRLQMAADELFRLRASSPLEQIVNAFNNFKILYYSEMRASIDPVQYQIGWSMLNYYQVDEVDLKANTELFAKLVYVVDHVLQLLP